MRLTVVGCSGSMSGPKSAASAYLVQARGQDDDGAWRTWSLTLDFGPGSMGQLLNYVDPADLDAMFITHCHADHMVDLVGMHVYRRWNPAGALGSVPVVGPQETLARLQGVDGVPASEVYATEFDFQHAKHGQSLSFGPLTVTPYTALHPVEAFGYRISGPSEEDPTKIVTLGYTGDTDLCESMSEMADGVDLLLAEAAFVEGRDTAPDMHLTGKRAGQLAASGGVGQLVLTHIQPWTDPSVPVSEAQETYSGPIAAATAGRVWEL